MLTQGGYAKPRRHHIGCSHNDDPGRSRRRDASRETEVDAPALAGAAQRVNGEPILSRMENLADIPDALVQERAVQHRLEHTTLNAGGEIVKLVSQSAAAAIIGDIVANDIAARLGHRLNHPRKRNGR